MGKNCLEQDTKIELAKRTIQEECVWVKISDWIDEYSPLDLAVGKPNVKTDEFIKQALRDTQNLPSCINQYTRSMGHPRLVEILAKMYSQNMNREINPYTEIVTTIGADGSIFCSVMALIEEGDEVIIFQPFYDSYITTVALAQGSPVFVTLNIDGCNSTTEVTFDRKELENAFSYKTKMLILNTPHNPTGKVFNQSELQFIADLCIKYNVVCLDDVVYDRYIYSESKHIFISTFEGMWERTLTIASAGKAFNVTGWKLGWTVGPARLIEGIHTIHSNCNYTSPSITQEAIATCLSHQLSVEGTVNDYWGNIRNLLRKKRDKLVGALKKANLKYILPEAGYFVIVDMQPIIDKYILNSPDEQIVDKNNQETLDMYDVAYWLMKEKKISGIPLGPFYNVKSRHIGNRYIRFCFFKKDDLLDKVTKVIETL